MSQRRDFGAIAQEPVYGTITIMAHAAYPKPLNWVASSRDDLRGLPKDVAQEMATHCGCADGRQHPSCKPLKGFTGAGVLEIIADYAGDTYRARLHREVRTSHLRLARVSEEEQEWRKDAAA